MRKKLLLGLALTFLLTGCNNAGSEPVTEEPSTDFVSKITVKDEDVYVPPAKEKHYADIDVCWIYKEYEVVNGKYFIRFNSATDIDSMIIFYIQDENLAKAIIAGGDTYNYYDASGYTNATADLLAEYKTYLESIGQSDYLASPDFIKVPSGISFVAEDTLIVAENVNTYDELVNAFTEQGLALPEYKEPETTEAPSSEETSSEETPSEEAPSEEIAE